MSPTNSKPSSMDAAQQTAWRLLWKLLLSPVGETDRDIQHTDASIEKRDDSERGAS